MNNQISSTGYSFFIETSATPIYQRIAAAFVNTLRELGHQVYFVNPWQYASDEEYLGAIALLNLDYCLITNSVTRLLSYCSTKAGFLYEFIDLPLIFIHHDSVFKYLQSRSRKIETDEMLSILEKLHIRRHRDWHFCLEYYNFLDLRALGFDKAYHIYHASEFQSLGVPPNYQHEVSFVGHVVDGECNPLEDFAFTHWINSDYWNRVVNVDYCMEKTANSFAKKLSKNSETHLLYVVCKYLYLSALHTYSYYFRGQIVKNIKDIPIDIIGGDPGYLNNKNTKRIIENHNIKYLAPLQEYTQTQEIYAGSKINLNITSLQFDTAVINRVIDVGAAGGFILTDWKSDLPKITSVAENISYRTVEELNEKIKYYLHPDHEKERLEIAATFQQDIKEKCNYLRVVKGILEKLSVTSNQNESLKIDLGCGGSKPKGFIGVDVQSGQGVDIVADLNKRFPFPDNCAEVIRAYDLIEHLENRIHTMNEIWRICKPGATVELFVPSTDGRGAFQDPTHISFWNINSFKYYCVEHPIYLKLNHFYGFKGSFGIISLDNYKSDDEVIHVRAVLKVLKRSAQSLQELFPDLNLRQFNVVAFPDWEQPEEVLAQELLELIEWCSVFESPERLTVLIYVEESDRVGAELFISGMLMELLEMKEMSEEDFNVEVNFISDLTPPQWENLSVGLWARFVLNHESLPENYHPFVEKTNVIERKES